MHTHHLLSELCSVCCTAHQKQKYSSLKKNSDAEPGNTRYVQPGSHRPSTTVLMLCLDTVTFYSGQRLAACPTKQQIYNTAREVSYVCTYKYGIHV